VRSGRQAVTSAYRMASGLSRSLPSARDMIPHTPRSLQRMADNNPLLIGAIGLGLGMVLGALMPLGFMGDQPEAEPRRRAARRARRQRRRAGPKRSAATARRGKGAARSVEPKNKPSEKSAAGS
jgi:hypothetical protein